MSVQAQPELDVVVELAEVLPDFDRDLDQPEPAMISAGHRAVRRVASRVTGLALVGVLAVVWGAVSTDRGTVPGPVTTVTVETYVGSALQADPVHGVIPSGRVVVGQDIASGSYIAIAAADSDGCTWTVEERLADSQFGSRRGQLQVVVATVDLNPGQVLTSQGCNWRFR